MSTDTCPDCGRRMGYDGHPYCPCAKIKAERMRRLRASGLEYIGDYDAEEE